MQVMQRCTAMPAWGVLMTSVAKKLAKCLFYLRLAFSKARNTALFSFMDHYGRKYAILVAWYFHAP